MLLFEYCLIKLKCTNLLKALSTIFHQNYQLFYLSEPMYFGIFKVRHPVQTVFLIEISIEIRMIKFWIVTVVSYVTLREFYFNNAFAFQGSETVNSTTNLLV